jgi:uncharacterized membrane protein YhiD involved in acid resistance
LLLDQVKEKALILTALSSKTISVQDIDNLAQVEIKADFIAEGRNNALLEQVVTLLKLKVRVSAIRWDFISEDGE